LVADAASIRQARHLQRHGWMRVASDNAGVLPWLDTGLAGMVASPLAAFCLYKLAAVAVAALL